MATSLLLKGSHLYIGQALELDQQNETLKACKARAFVKAYLATKKVINE